MAQDTDAGREGHSFGDVTAGSAPEPIGEAELRGRRGTGSDGGAP